MEQTATSPSPAPSRTALVAIGVLGHLALVLAVLVAAAGAAGIVVGAINYALVFIKLALPLALLLWAIMRSVFVRVTPPDGVEVTATSAPALHAMIDDVQSATGIKPPKVVLLDDSLNASVTSIPRLGGFAGRRRYLTIGLPLMYAVSPDELRATIAHEFGHLSRRQGRLKPWLYDVRSLWTRIAMQADAALKTKVGGAREWFGLSSARSGHRLMRAFARWYLPRLDRMTLALMREHEFAADQVSAEVESPIALARGLARITVADGALTAELESTVRAHAHGQADPPPDVFDLVVATVRTAPDRPRAERWLRDALAADAGDFDTHPCLRNRVEAVGIDPTSLGLSMGRLASSAGDVLSPDIDPAVIATIAENYRTAIAPGWAGMHAALQASQHELDELERQPKSAESEVRRAALLDFRGKGDAVIPTLRHAVELDPASSAARFALGARLLEADDPEGIEHLERAIEIAPVLETEGCWLIADFLTNTGDGQAAKPYRDRLSQAATTNAAAAEERDTVSVNDALSAAELPADEIDHITKQLARFPQVESAHLVRKELQHFPDQEVHFLIVIPENIVRWEVHDGDEAEVPWATQILTAITTSRDLRLFVLGKRTAIAKHVAQLPAAEIYRVAATESAWPLSITEKTVP